MEGAAFGGYLEKTRLALGCVISLGPMNLIWLLQDLIHHAFGQNLTILSEKRITGLAEGEG